MQKAQINEMILSAYFLFHGSEAKGRTPV